LIKVFISHSSEDVALAEHLVDLLRVALRLSTKDIRCTSVEGCRLPGGVDTNKHLRDEILAATIFIGLITEAGLTSAYVLFELGARWGAKKQLIPLLAAGISPDILQAPLSGLSALSCGSPSDLDQLLYQASEALSIQLEPTSVYQSKILDVLKYPLAPRVSTLAEQRVPQKAVDEIAELRSEAITTLLNRPVRSDAQLAMLESDTKKWWESVKVVLDENFTKAEVLNFTRLGTVPTYVFPNTYNEKHAKIRREFALQERRLLDIIARHTR
jgi:hypothetical protein